MANPIQLNILCQGRDRWNAWRATQPKHDIPDLGAADLHGLDLSGYNFRAAYLRDVVEDVKASGLVTKWIEKSGVKGLSAAPPAGK